VLEPLGGYLLLAERLFHEPKRFAEGWNFGPIDEDARPVSWVVERLAREFPGASWQGDPGPHPEEAGVLRLDCSKARTKLGYCPRLRLDEALRWVALWYREFLAGGDVLALSLSQIEAYEALEPGVAA
jgi:CDP-glucose 4,6-dehydratase